MIGSAEEDDGTPTREFLDGLLRTGDDADPKSLEEMLDGLDPQTQALLAQTNALIASTQAVSISSTADPTDLLHGHPDFRDLAVASDASLWEGNPSARSLSSLVFDDICLMCFEARLRPDVPQHAIREACAAICTRKGLALNSESSSLWQAKRVGGKPEGTHALMRLGVAVDRTRSLVILLVRTKQARSNEFAQINELAEELATSMKLGLMESGLTLSSLSVDAFQASFDGDEVKEDVQLDKDYLTDLELMCKSEMTGRQAVVPMRIQ